MSDNKKMRPKNIDAVKLTDDELTDEELAGVAGGGTVNVIGGAHNVYG